MNRSGFSLVALAAGNPAAALTLSDGPDGGLDWSILMDELAKEA